MFILVKEYEGQIDESWGYRGPFATSEEAFETGKKLLVEEASTWENVKVDEDSLCFYPMDEEGDPEHVTELSILRNPMTNGNPEFGAGFSASSGRFFLTRNGVPLEGVMFDSLLELYQHGLVDELWKANSPPRVSWFT